MKKDLANLLDKTAVYLGWYASRLRSATNAHRLCAWRTQYPHEAVLFDHPLTPRSTVVDLGGFRGDFTAEMVARYGCRCLVFEPVPQFADRISRRFEQNPQVQVISAGLAAKDATLAFHVHGESTSTYRGTGQAVEGQLLAFDRALNQLGVDRIDLLKINIEGGEFDLLDWMVESDWIDRVDRIQVQFHDFVPDAEARRDRLVQALSQTHQQDFCVPFVWEGWSRLHASPLIRPTTITAKCA